MTNESMVIVGSEPSAGIASPIKASAITATTI